MLFLAFKKVQNVKMALLRFLTPDKKNPPQQNLPLPCNSICVILYDTYVDILFIKKVLFKKNWQNEFFQNIAFFKNVSRFKARYKKIMRFTQCIVQVCVRLCRNFFWQMCDIEANIEYFAFLNCSNLTFSQVEIIIKFLKSFVKEGLNFNQIALCEGFSYRKCEILWLLSWIP